MVRSLLIRVPDAQQRRLVEGPAQELHAHGQPADEPARQRQSRDAGEVGGHGEDVLQVHLQRVGRLLAEPERGRGRGGHGHDVALAERALEVAPDQRPHLLRAQVVGVVVARRTARTCPG